MTEYVCAYRRGLNLSFGWAMREPLYLIRADHAFVVYRGLHVLEPMNPISVFVLKSVSADMRYIGGKSLMLDNIASVIRDNTRGVRVVTDIFSGTGVVANELKSRGYAVNANDILYFSYVLNKGTLEMNEPVSSKLREIIGYLNNLSVNNSPWFDIGNAFIYNNYSPHEGCKRMYFQCDNAIRIDLIRQEIERLRNQLTENEYFYLLALLINAVPYVSNITGTYGAYLKYWDKRTYNDLVLEEIPTEHSDVECHCYNMEAQKLAEMVESDLVYLDPPYNGRQYLPNYHVLETIARYDNPRINGVTGQRDDPEKISDFCKKSKARKAFKNLLETLNCRYLLLSYNNEGLLSTEEMSQLLLDVGMSDTFQLFEYDYRRYKNKIPNNKAGLKEQLYLIQKEI